MKPTPLAVLVLPLLLATLSPIAAAQPRPAAHTIEVQLDPAAHAMRATDAIDLDGAGGGELVLALHPALVVDAVEAAGKAVPWRLDPASAPGHTATLRVTVPAGTGRVDVRWHGTVHQDASATRFSREAAELGISATIDPAGTFLAPWAAWYPQSDGLARFRMAIVTPAGHEAVAEGERVGRTVQDATLRTEFLSEGPLDGVHCIAGPYEVVERRAGDVLLLAYVYAADRELAAPYLDDVARYLDLYRELLGPYPFRKLAVVEAFFPAGYGMPSFTYLGQQVMRLPFIRATSLGHEVCHNWWGNGVLVDAAEGNWCEGLTTYHADYLYDLRRSEAAGREHRARVLADYAAYVREGREVPLSEFRARHDSATRAVGYGKCLMVFEMLALRLGRERLDGALREVVRARMGKLTGWRHLRQAVETAFGEDLGWFFEQWVTRPGAPALELSGVAFEPTVEPGASRLSFALAADAPWRLQLPIEVRWRSGRVLRRTVEGTFGPEARRFAWLLDGDERPESIAVDPEHRTMRRMTVGETPATLRLLLGAEGASIVLPSRAAPEAAAAYRRLADGLAGRLAGSHIVEAGAELPAGPALVLGTPEENPHAAGLVAAAGAHAALDPESWRLEDGRAGDGAVLVLAVRRAGGAIAVLVAARSPAALDATGPKLPHYGRDGALLFDGGKLVARGVLDAPESPLVVRLAE